ncbi:hypothetical protein D3C86_1793120 [compost metagenome]
MFLLNLNEFMQIRNITIHAVHTFNYNQCPAAVSAGTGKNPVHGFPVIMRKRHALRSREQAALNQTVVGQLVVQHDILFAHQFVDRRHIGRMSSCVDQCIFCTYES